MTVWKCVSCGSDLPLERRIDMRYCKVRCRVQAHRIRKGEGRHVRPTKKHGHTALKVALGTVAAATAAAAAIELVREGQDARLEEQQRKIADQQEQLLKSQTEKEELRRELEDLRNRVDQVTKEKEAQLQKAQAEKEESRRTQEGLRKQVEQLTREKKQVESQLCQRRDELAKEKQLVKTLRSSVENAHLDVTLTEHRLQEERRGQAALVNWASQREEEHRRQLSESNQRIHALLKHNDELTRQLSVATDSQVVQFAEWSASQSQLRLQSRVDNAEAESQRLKQQLRSVEVELSSATKKLAAKEQQKQLPPARQTEPTSSAQTALAVANQNIATLAADNRRLSKELQAATDLAKQWKDHADSLSREFAALQDGMVAQEETETPGLLTRALGAIGLIGTSVLVGAGAATALGSGDSGKALGPASGQRSLGPKSQLSLPPRSKP